MKFQRATLLIAIAIGFGTGAVALRPGTSLGQNQQPPLIDTKLPSFVVDKADIREALRALFRNLGKVQYTIAPDVLGTVTLSMRGVEFQDVLDALVRQVNATYVLEDGVYMIQKRPSIRWVSGGDGYYATDSEHHLAMTTDNRFLFVYCEGWVYKLDKRDLKEIARHALNEPRITIQH